MLSNLFKRTPVQDDHLSNDHFPPTPLILFYIMTLSKTTTCLTRPRPLYFIDQLTKKPVQDDHFIFIITCQIAINHEP